MNSTAILTVRDLTREIKGLIEGDPTLQKVWVKGEISNFTHHNRGHMYFTLKDEEARIKSVMFKGNNQFLKFTPKSGMKVIVQGEVSVYERDGQYQLYIKQMQPDGIGALYQAYEDLKRKLQQQGWFDTQNKMPIVATPRKIGVITSPTGAAIRDIITTIQRRYPVAEVCIFPVLVQGEEAPASIAKAIKKAQMVTDLDTLIVGRGGGSIEELWAFNEEIVAEAIYSSQVPIISAVGHETDFTIADFVADLRAPTPTAAAELAVPHIEELRHRVLQLRSNLQKQIRQQVRENRSALESLRQSYAFKFPMQLIHQKEQELDTHMEKLARGMNRFLIKQSDEMQQLLKVLKRVHPKSSMEEAKLKYVQLHQRFSREMKLIIDGKKKEAYYHISKLEALSPLSIMTKGYSLVYDKKENNLIKSVRHIDPGQAVRIRMHDGELDCQVWGIEEEGNNEYGK